jgi:LysM repeat protein
MVSGRPVFKLLALSFLLAFLLVACVRPLSQSDEVMEAEATAEAEAGAATDEVAPGDEDAEEGAAEAGAAEAGAVEEGAAEEGAPDEALSEGEAEAGAEEAAEEEPAPAEGEAVEGTADEVVSEDENVGGGTPDTPEEPMEEAAAEEQAAGETAASEEGAAGGEPAESATTLPATHTVAAGENLYRIGLKYGMSWVVLAQYNHLPNPDRIYTGQVLQIPGTQPPPSQPPPQQPEYASYVVKAGDNLYRIGLAYGVSWVDIAAANGIVNPNVIYPGQVLKIPTNSPGQSPQVTHTVRPGETLFRISLQYGVSWVAIAQANNIHSPYVIYSGQTLIIPSG